MSTIDDIFQGMFESKTKQAADKQAAEINPALAMAQMVGQPGAFAAFYGNQRNQAMANYGGNITDKLSGGAYSSGERTTPDQLNNIGMQKISKLMQSGAGDTEEGQKQILQMARAIDPQAAMQLATKFNETNKAKQATGQQQNALATLVESSAIPEGKRNAVSSALRSGAPITAEEVIKLAYPNEADRYPVIGGTGVFDTVTQKFLVPPTTENGVTGGLGSSGLTYKAVTDMFPPEQYDNVLYGRFLGAIRRGVVLDDAVKLIEFKDDDGWSVVETADGGVEATLRRRSPQGQEMQSELNATNTSIRQAHDKARNMNRIVDSQIQRLNEKDKDGNYVVSQGDLAGVALSYFAGTPEYDFQADMETVLANLGMGELRAMRDSAKNGASGLGQLTEKELSKLESLVVNLNRKGQGREQVTRNLNEIRTVYDNILKIQGDYNWDEYVYSTRENQTDNSTVHNTPAGRVVVTPRKL